jgi:hypothetical protein
LRDGSVQRLDSDNTDGWKKIHSMERDFYVLFPGVSSQALKEPVREVGHSTPSYLLTYLLTYSMVQDII